MSFLAKIRSHASCIINYPKSYIFGPTLDRHLIWTRVNMARSKGVRLHEIEGEYRLPLVPNALIGAISDAVERNQDNAEAVIATYKRHYDYPPSWRRCMEAERNMNENTERAICAPPGEGPDGFPWRENEAECLLKWLEYYLVAPILSQKQQHICLEMLNREPANDIQPDFEEWIHELHLSEATANLLEAICRKLARMCSQGRADQRTLLMEMAAIWVNPIFYGRKIRNKEHIEQLKVVVMRLIEAAGDIAVRQPVIAGIKCITVIYDAYSSKTFDITPEVTDASLKEAIVGACPPHIYKCESSTMTSFCPGAHLQSPKGTVVPIARDVVPDVYYFRPPHTPTPSRGKRPSKLVTMMDLIRMLKSKFTIFVLLLGIFIHPIGLLGPLLGLPIIGSGLMRGIGIEVARAGHWLSAGLFDTKILILLLVLFPGPYVVWFYISFWRAFLQSLVIVLMGIESGMKAYTRMLMRPFKWLMKKMREE